MSAETTHVQPHRPELDISRVEPDEAPPRLLRRISNPREPGFAIVITRSTLEAIHTHGQSDTSVEICGVLVGEIRHDRISPYLLIDAHIAGEKAKSRGTQVTFTADTWDAIQQAMEQMHAGKKIVGWYHTHPGFGVFLSGMDLFIQDNFFNLPWQVAWVYDPIAQTDGVFVWKEGRSEKADFLIEEDLGEWGHNFRAKLPDADRPSLAAERETKAQRLRAIALVIIVFMLFFVGSWFLMQWLASQGFRIRLPIE